MASDVGWRFGSKLNSLKRFLAPTASAIATLSVCQVELWAFGLYLFDTLGTRCDTWKTSFTRSIGICLDPSTGASIWVNRSSKCGCICFSSSYSAGFPCGGILTIILIDGSTIGFLAVATVDVSIRSQLGIDKIKFCWAISFTFCDTFCRWASSTNSYLTNSEIICLDPIRLTPILELSIRCFIRSRRGNRKDSTSFILCSSIEFVKGNFLTVRLLAVAWIST